MLEGSFFEVLFEESSLVQGTVGASDVEERRAVEGPYGGLLRDRKAQHDFRCESRVSYDSLIREEGWTG